MSSRAELAALKNLLSPADRILKSTPAMLENRTAACRELLPLQAGLLFIHFVKSDMSLVLTAAQAKLRSGLAGT
ncbi:MAG TPA: hypothetical protein VEH30_01430 [Terriglobales bacterium]|nr:hypothetical protein [Terriglobales bacterium]